MSTGEDAESRGFDPFAEATPLFNTHTKPEAAKDQGKIEDAFKILNDALLKHKDKTYDRYALLTFKFELLSGLSIHKEALEAATEAPRIYVRGICPLQALERLSPKRGFAIPPRTNVRGIPRRGLKRQLGGQAMSKPLGLKAQ